jgi:hypothetical protein
MIQGEFTAKTYPPFLPEIFTLRSHFHVKARRRNLQNPAVEKRDIVYAISNI